MPPVDDQTGHLSPTGVFELMAAAVHADLAKGKAVTAMVDLTDTGEQYVLTLEDSALRYAPAGAGEAENVDVTLQVPSSMLLPALASPRTTVKMIAVGRAWIAGDSRKLSELIHALDPSSEFFAIGMP